MGPLSAHHTDCPIPTMGDRSVQTPPPSSHLGAMNVGTGWEVCTERCMLPSAQRARHGDRASLSPSDIAERRGVSPSEGPQTLTAYRHWCLPSPGQGHPGISAAASVSVMEEMVTPGIYFPVQPSSSPRGPPSIPLAWLPTGRP